MREQLLLEREQKIRELENKKERCLALNKEISHLDSKVYRVTVIENGLAEHYAEARKKFPIDRSVEPEIENVVLEKECSVEEAIKKYEKLMTVLYRNERDALNRVEEYADKIRYRIWFNGEERKENIKEGDKFEKQRTKETEKEYVAKRKEAKKDCLDALKQLFGELEVDIKRFYKKGISKENIILITNLMEKICERGTEFGTIPVSYQQKIYKWKTIAEEIPVDEEFLDKKKEAAEQKSINQKLADAQKSASVAKESIKNLKLEIIRNKKDIERLQHAISLFESNLKNKMPQINREALEKEQELRKSCEEEKQSLKNRYEESLKKQGLEIEKVQALVNEMKQAILKLEQDKESLKKELKTTFVLAFGTKRKLNERIESVNVQLSKEKNQLIEQEKELAELKSSTLTVEYERELKRKEGELKEELRELENNRKTQINELEKERRSLEGKLGLAEKEAPKLQKELAQQEQNLETAEKNIPVITQQQMQFHADYLIRTFGDKYGFDEQVSKKKRELIPINSSINNLEHEIRAIDEKLRQIEKIEEAEREAVRKALVEKQKEEERLRRERNERQIRIQQELQQREREQEALNIKKINSILIEQLVSEFESNPDHQLLKEATWPLMDDGKRILTNSIVRKQYTQEKIIQGCRQYVLWFVDNNAEPISDQRIIIQKPLGEITATSFELKADGGFISKNYYLFMMNYDSNEIIGAQKYKINISFANDFDF